jgi:hypothetical protein
VTQANFLKLAVLNVNRARQVLLAMLLVKHVKIAVLVDTVNVKKMTVSPILIQLRALGAPLVIFLMQAAADANCVNLESSATPLVAAHVKIAHLVQKEATKIPIQPLVAIAQEVIIQIRQVNNFVKIVTQVSGGGGGGGTCLATTLPKKNRKEPKTSNTDNFYLFFFAPLRLNPGQFSNKTKVTACETCSKNTFQKEKRQHTCKRCPADLLNNSKSTDCVHPPWR